MPRHPKTKLSEVWIVQHDETPDNTVLGVFTTQDEARVFMDEVKQRALELTAPTTIPPGRYGLNPVLWTPGYAA